MAISTSFFYLVMLAQMSRPIASAPDGNISVAFDNGSTVKVTSSGKDRFPSICQSAGSVVYLRDDATDPFDRRVFVSTISPLKEREIASKELRALPTTFLGTPVYMDKEHLLFVISFSDLNNGALFRIDLASHDVRRLIVADAVYYPSCGLYANSVIALLHRSPLENTKGSAAVDRFAVISTQGKVLKRFSSSYVYFKQSNCL